MVSSKITNGQKSFAAALLVLSAFLVQYFNWILGTYIPYGIFLCAASFILVWDRNIKIEAPKFNRQNFSKWFEKFDLLALCWIPAVVFIGFSSFSGGLAIKEILDVLTYVVCAFFVLFCGESETIFQRAFKVIKVFAIYYAATVWIQFLLPPVYNLYLGILPEEVSENLLKLQNFDSSYAGFSTNAGFTAGHIVAGIILIFSKRYNQSFKRPKTDWFIILFLVASLLVTGKRTHLLAAIAVICLIYVISASGKKRISHLKRLAVVAAAGAGLLMLMLIFFRFIPVVDRLAETIIGLFNGEDITSGRAKLYDFAWDLFLKNPVFGIGWDQYHLNTIGTVTLMTELDVHNIYLQMLAELGLVGFLLIITPMVFTLIATFKQLNKRQAFINRSTMWESALLFSLGYQIFFFIYGITGNPLYDYNYIIFYFFACAICVVSKRNMLGNCVDFADNAQNDKPKAGIITFHFAHNQGAVLQCYALQTYLSKLGHAVSVINYRPPYHTVKYSAWKNPFLVARSNWKRNSKKRLDKRLIMAARGFARGIIANIKRTDSLADQKFNAFIEKYLTQTKLYTSLEELKLDPPKMDAYISGSDQLWNPELLDYCFDPAYFMDFGFENTKRITYAVSLKEHYCESEKNQLKKLCSKIDGLCIREGNEDLVQTLGGDVKVCIDPTLLLDKQDYEPLESEKKVNEPYVFVYGFETTDQINEAVKTIADKLNLKVINGSPKRIKLSGDCRKIYNYSPDEFLSYINHADYVVTNSFHGTAFSIIYKKKFVVVPHTSRGRRMTELLAKLGIANRIWRDASCPWESDIDYRALSEKLEMLRDNSKTYLEQNLK